MCFRMLRFAAVSIGLLLSGVGMPSDVDAEELNPLFASRNPLQSTLHARTLEFGEIAEPRKSELERLAGLIRKQLAETNEVKLVFICTHNSRRSQFAEVWGAAAAAFYEIRGVSTFSGGTEATAFNPRTVAALQRAGVRIDVSVAGSNPHYLVHVKTGKPPLECFSKVYRDPVNPQSDFWAIMTCSDADENCPIVHGASLRFSLTYEDPKHFDGTSEEDSRYDERSHQIAREMLYLFSKV